MGWSQFRILYARIHRKKLKISPLFSQLRVSRGFYHRQDFTLSGDNAHPQH